MDGAPKAPAAAAAKLIDALVGAPARASLVVEQVALGGGGRFAEAAAAIGTAHGATLLELRMPSCCLGDADATSLRTLVASCPSLQLLDLQGNALGARAAGELAQALRSHAPALLELRLASNCLTDEGCAAVAEALADSPCLRFLDLSDNAVGRLTARRVATLLATGRPPLRHLDLSHGALDDDDAAELARALASRAPDLLACAAPPDDGGAKRARSLRLAIDLRANNIGHRGARALARAVDACTPEEVPGAVYVDLRLN